MGNIKSFFSAVLSASLLYLLGVVTFAFADSQRVIQYRYDGAGNIVAIQSDRNLGPPDVTTLTPAFIHKESTAVISATGSNLAAATVATSTPGLDISQVKNLSETEVLFTLSADDTAESGPGSITFATRLGTDTESIVIAERTPVISTIPNPIVLSPDGRTVLVTLIFDQPFETAQFFDLTVQDTSIASVSDSSVTLTAGEVVVTMTISGLSPGNTNLEINQLSNFLALAIPVVVTEPGTALPNGTYTFQAKPVGVATFLTPTLSTTGVFVTQRPLGVATYLRPSLSTTGIFTTPKPLGVATFLEPSLSTTGLFVTPLPLGLTFGTVIDQISPASAARGSSLNLTIDGYELTEVTAIGFSPADGITQTDTFTVSPDGLQINVPISIATTASTGMRAVVLTTSGGEQVFSDGILTIQ